ncbi:hypothetical protein GOP47_0008819 [Adiantum capillus-veneris]|uniref:Uncharacterized protein n=1 Tax=Adiantum capillus-veneris TaxID=13818 RepID=A0A9D4UZC8_ADICA|nr:hypothetical protein GOP47_0008819 [Adiantum capillus-veneris]
MSRQSPQGNFVGGKENQRDFYHLHVELSRELEPLSKRSQRDFIPTPTNEMLRLQSKKNLDLWVEGSMYTKDPIIISTLPFRDTSSLINVVGDGYNGLYEWPRMMCCNCREIFPSTKTKAYIGVKNNV